MTDSSPCGNCKACKEFNGKNGNGYQPCHRPVPPDIPTPPIKWIDSDDPQDDSLSFEWCIWFFGICIGIAIGLQLAKIL